MNCRHCNTQLNTVFADLVNCPPSNSMLKKTQLNQPETFFPLKVLVCEKCFLVQVDEVEKTENLFTDEYTYFSSFSKGWLEHCKAYSEKMIDRLELSENQQVVEIASNDGYLLQYFLDKGISVLGIEPTANTAKVAIEKGIDSLVEFFGENLAFDLQNKSIQADLLIGNNVLAHVPDINDFVKGLKLLLKPEGTITMEFPHLLNLIKYNQFDTIYHEHFSYLSLNSVNLIFKSVGLEIYDVDEIPTHGGSLRIYAKHIENSNLLLSPNVSNVLKKEFDFGLLNISTYKNFQKCINSIKNDFLEFLIQQKKSGKKVIGYGAAAKGNTLMNYAGIRGNDLIEFVVDASPHKQNKYLPGIHIPVVHESEIQAFKPDYIIIFPWNIKAEIQEQLAYIKNWGGQFVTFVPEIEVFT